MTTVEFLLSVLLLSILVTCAFVFNHHFLIKRMESYLTNYHGYDPNKELGFYKLFNEKEESQ